MRESKRPKAQKPARFREESCQDSSSSNEKQIPARKKMPDLRDKIKSKRKQTDSKRVSELHVSRKNVLSDLSDEVTDEQNFCPDYEVEEIDIQDRNDEGDNNPTDTDLSDNSKGTNNNTQRVKSVVIETQHRGSHSGSKRTTKKVTVTRQSETEDGELSSSDNPDKLDELENWIEEVDDDKLAKVLKKHQDRIQRLTGEVKDPQRNGEGETDNLANNIRRMSMKDNPRNSRSEDTIYSQLVKQRQEFEQRANSDREIPDPDDHDKFEGSLEKAQQIHSGADCSTSSNDSPNTSKTDGQSTDETDKQIVMNKFVDSSLNPTEPTDSFDHNDNISDLSEFVLSDGEDFSPPPKRQRGDQGKKRKITVEEYNKRREREKRREEERKEKQRKQ